MSQRHHRTASTKVIKARIQREIEASKTSKKSATAPLKPEEWVELEKLIDSTGHKNLDLFNAAREVHRLRGELDSAEDELRRAASANAELRSKIAPLLHRMPKA